MRVTLHLFGLEILDLDWTTDPDEDVKAYGDVVSSATAEAGHVPNRDGYEDYARGMGFR